MNTFSQLPAVKKYSKNGAGGKFFGPSYFDPALEGVIKITNIYLGNRKPATYFTGILEEFRYSLQYSMNSIQKLPVFFGPCGKVHIF